MWAVPAVDVTRFKNTFAFAVKTGLLQVTVASPVPLGLANSIGLKSGYWHSATRVNRTEKSLHSASLDCLLRSTSINASKMRAI